MVNTIGEIQLFTGNYAPTGWALCQGQLLPINAYTVVFSILGTTYGGNGTSNFQLPDFRSRVAVGAGQGMALSFYEAGQTGGTTAISLQINNLPPHNHPVTGVVTMNGSSLDGDSDSPLNTYPATLAGTDMYATTNNGNMLSPMKHELIVASTGHSTPVPIVQPVLALNFIICLTGDFPNRF